MTGKIIVYEIRQRFWHWTTLLFFLILAFQGLWYTKGNFDYYVNEGLLMNASTLFYKNLAGGGMLMIIIVAIITGTSLYKDIQHKTGQWIYTMPIHEKQFYLGRFFSAFLFNVIIATGYIAGMLLTPYAGLGEAHRFGPAPIGQLFHGFLFLTVPNLFLLTSLFFFALVFTRRMAAGYLSVLLTVIAFLVMQTTAESSGITTVLALADPFGYIGVDELIQGLPTAERNTAYIPLDGNLLINRLIWCSLAVLLLIVSYVKFSFKSFGAVPNTRGKIITQVLHKVPQTAKNVIGVKLSFTTPDFLKKLWSLARLEFKIIVRPTSFKVIIGVILLMAVLQNLFWNAGYYIGPTVPLTSTMTLFRLTFGVFILILIMVWAGELFFKDRVVNIHTITDTLPVPVWVTQLSWFIAMMGMSFILALSFMVIGIIIQILKGGAGLIEWDLYVYDILGYNWGWLTYVLWIAVVFFISGLTGNRFLTHVLSVGAFFVLIMAFELGLAEQVRFAYGAVPGLEDYSEISGYGIWYTSAQWFFLMWLVLAVALVLLGIYFWERGTGIKWSQKLRFQGKQLYLPGKIAALLAIAAFVVFQSFIIKNIDASKSFRLSAVEEKEKAAYETTYGYLKDKAHPKYSHIDLTFDFYPAERKAIYSARLRVTNPSERIIDTLFLNTDPSVEITSVSSKGKDFKLVRRDTVHNVMVYLLPKKMWPQDTLALIFKAKKEYKGFTQSGSEPQPDLMYNGSFGSIHDFLPLIGYKDDKELNENRKRADQGLPLLASRMAPVTDNKALHQSIFAPDGNRVTGKITISTSEDQIPLAPGKLEKSWTKNNRNYRSYVIEKATPFNWYLGSGDYVINPSKTQRTTVQILASPKHNFNIDLYRQAIHKTIAFVGSHLGTYPYTEVRLHEIPYYQEDFYAFANSIAISEKEGWYADTTNMPERAYIFQSVASQIIKHWLQESIDVANVQGGYMLTEALPEALSLRLLQEELGPEALELMLKKKQDFYAKEKHDEANTEPPLLYADGVEYLEAYKGAKALYELMDTIGTQAFDTLLREWVNKDENIPKRFIDLYKRLLDAVPTSKKEEIKQLFEEV